MRHVTVGLLLLLLYPLGVFADFTGPVVSVLMATPSKFCTTPPPERIRLSGIECPQKGQAFDTIDIEFYIGVYTLPSFFRPDL